MNSNQLKTEMKRLGADLCGIASVNRFNNCPAGFHPKDIYKETKSIVSFAKRIPDSIVLSNSPVPYTSINEFVLNELIQIGYNTAIYLQNNGITALPIPSEPYEYWNEEIKEGKGILSLKYAGYLSGLGIIGKNQLLTNIEYGNRINLGALLLNIELEEDAIDTRSFCKPECNLCITNCPGRAIKANYVEQKLCRDKSGKTNKKGYFLYICNTCRVICPYSKGYKNLNQTVKS
jgi:epoxyqueuosine reductase QueG